MIYVLAHTPKKANLFIAKHAEVAEKWVIVRGRASFAEGEKGFILICVGQYWKNPAYKEVFDGSTPWHLNMRILYGHELE